MKLILLSSVILLVIIITIIITKTNRLKYLRSLRAAWGSIPEKPRSTEDASLFFEFTKDISHLQTHQLDDNTWNDLNFDDIFRIMDRTNTPVGSQYLYHLLRTPALNKTTLDDRESVINLFSRDQKLREQIQLILRHLNEKNAKYLPYSLWKPLPEVPGYAKFLPIMTLISTIVLLLALGNILHPASVFLIFSVNLIIHSLIKRKIEIFIHSFQYLGVLISVSDRISVLKTENLKTVQNVLRKNLKETRNIAKRLFTLQFKDQLGIVEYFNIYFLSEVTGFFSAVKKMDRHSEKLKNLFKTIGYLDALISVASFRNEYNRYCQPVFTENSKNFDVDEIYHPLLKNSVSNSFRFDCQSVIITGSNMSGKTTFLKTLGVNAVLAQSINTCMAGRYNAPFLKVKSCIGITDNLLLGKSYYLAEVESLLDILKSSDQDNIHLFILDEILRGTNSTERVAASIAILKYLANNKDFILVSTHDMKLPEIMNDQYSNFHFSEKISTGGLVFDYKLHGGVATTRNAIALLEYAGYPESITKNAKEYINRKNV
ncbi:MAG: hypothetical protein AB7T22_13635 [Calditrichaceae bacterium]